MPRRLPPLHQRGCDLTGGTYGIEEVALMFVTYRQTVMYWCTRYQLGFDGRSTIPAYKDSDGHWRISANAVHTQLQAWERGDL